MTWSFNPYLTENKDKVRSLIGDTDENAQQISDETIYGALSHNSDNIYSTARQMVRSLIARYARRADVKIEGVSTSYGGVIKAYQALLRDIDKEELQNGGGLGEPIAPGTSINDMNAARLNTDRPPSAFETGQFDNPPYRTEKEVNDGWPD
jgi:hypothetical protein